MTAFRVGERVELISCPSFPGAVTGFTHGKALVLFDDFRNEPPKPFRPENLQLAARRVSVHSVPEPVGCGTSFCSLHASKNEEIAKRLTASFLAQGRGIARKKDSAAQCRDALGFSKESRPTVATRSHQWR
jgi:hypothetical protein